jgi:UDP-glucose 4-epimerase
LVTGGAGYIGSHTVLALTTANWNVTVVDDLSTGSARLVPNDVELCIGDIGDAEFISSVVAAVQPEAIIHFAGALSVPESIVDPLKY